MATTHAASIHARRVARIDACAQRETHNASPRHGLLVEARAHLMRLAADLDRHYPQAVYIDTDVDDSGDYPDESHGLASLYTPAVFGADAREALNIGENAVPGLTEWVFGIDSENPEGADAWEGLYSDGNLIPVADVLAEVDALPYVQDGQGTGVHVILAAFEVAADSEDEAHAHVRSLMPTPEGGQQRPRLDSWWIAEDRGREDRAEHSAIFVEPGAQDAAAWLMANLERFPDAHAAYRERIEAAEHTEGDQA